jgi:hypothetical protein
MTLNDIHLATQQMGRGFKRETLGKHFRICLGGVPPVVDTQAVADASKEAQTQSQLDFAAMVQRRATEMLAAGELRVTAQHGLTAQALLDRRAEKQADRDLAVNMARLLSGSIIMTPYEVVEARDVTPDGATSRLLPDGLAPMDIVDA